MEDRAHLPNFAMGADVLALSLDLRKLGISADALSLVAALRLSSAHECFARSVALGGCTPDDFTHTHTLYTLNSVHSWIYFEC